jgi:hypothetical protein
MTPTKRRSDARTASHLVATCHRLNGRCDVPLGQFGLAETVIEGDPRHISYFFSKLNAELLNTGRLLEFVPFVQNGAKVSQR